MKIIHITASYKPAYIYGGPIQSVGKLCEALERNKDQRPKTKDNLQNNPPPPLSEGGQILEVLTTTANGKQELNVEIGKQQIVDGVPVTYFKRWTKDHSHFSPGLLLNLRNKILENKNPPPPTSYSYAPPSRGGKEPPRLAGTPPPKKGSKLVIHIHAWWNLVSVLSCLVAKWYNIPVILSPRGMLTSYTQGNRNAFVKKIIHKLIGRRLLQYCHIHATSEQEKNDILKIIQPKSIAVIPNLVSFKYQVLSSKYQVLSSKYQVASSKYQVLSSKYQESSSKYQAHSEAFKMIFLSRIEEKKGLGLLFESLALLNIKWSLTLAGSGADDYVESLKWKAESLKLGERIKWIGQVANEEKFDLLAQHDLCILTSYNENFANVVVESLSVSTPVLVSDKVGLADYIIEKDLGWVTVLNVEEICRQLTNISQHKIKLDSIRANAPQIIREDFNDKVLVGRYMDLYEKILRLRSE